MRGRARLTAPAVLLAVQLYLASPAMAVEAQPGDACPVVGRNILSGGPELSGASHLMVCNASNVWSSILDNDAAGNAALAHAVSLPGDISPPQITANQNDYNPANLATASVLRLNTDASRNITSLAGGADGRIVTIMNVGSFPIVLKNDDGATGTAANRFALTGDLTLAAQQSAMLMYDSTASRWRQIANGLASGSLSFPLLANPAGSVTAPAYSFNGDSNTGMFSDTADTVEFTAGGTEVLELGTVASAVNYVRIIPAILGAAPTITNVGGNTNGAGLGLNLAGKNASAPGSGGTISITGGDGNNSPGGAVQITGGTGGSGSAGGWVLITGGSAAAAAGSSAGGINIRSSNGSGTGTGGAGGSAYLQSGNAGGTGNNSGGTTTISAGDSTGNSTGGAVTVTAGGGGTSGAGGAITLTGGYGAGGNAAGAINISGGQSFDLASTGGAVNITAADGVNVSTGASGGNVTITAGNAKGSAANNGGNITLTAGTETSTGTPGFINLASGIKFSNDLSPAQITANQNDYAPAGLGAASVLRLNTNASRNITSLAGGADGRIITIMNVGSFNIVLKNDDGATGTAANRFALTGDLTLAAKQSAILMYDSASSRWRQIANGTATGSGDNLGNHIATQNIQLGSYWLSGDGGNEGVFVDSAGKVGVGTTAPQAPLHIGAGRDAPNDSPLLYLAGTGTTVLALRDSSSDVEGQFYVYNGHVGMGSRSNHDFYLVANDSEEVVLTAAGRFGIGTNAPNTTLDVNGFIEWKGQARVSSDFSKTNDTTLAAIPGLSVALEAGKTYSFQIFLYTTQSGACCVSHIKADLNGGTATATTIIGNAVSFGGSNVNYTALNTSICTEPITTATATCFIAGTITVNAAGTFSPRFAQLGSNATPAIVKAGSSMIIDQIN